MVQVLVIGSVNMDVVNRYALEEARNHGVKTYLNPAPAFEIPVEVYTKIHTLVVNETEAVVMTGLSVEEQAQAEAAAQ